MPKILLIIFLLFSGYTSLAQTVLISGKIAKTRTDTIFIAVHPNPLSAQQAQSKSAINQQGQFSLPIPLKQPTIASFVYANEAVPVFLRPGTQLYVHFKAGNFLKTLKFKGEGANENNFLVAYHLKFIENGNYQTPDQESLTPEAFLDFLNNRKKDQFRFLKSYIAKHSVSEAFKSYIISEIEYSWANDRLKQIDLNDNVKGKQSKKLTPDDYYFLNQLELNNPNGTASPAYTTFLKNYFNLLAATAGHRPTDPDYYQAIYNLVKEKLASEPRNLMLASNVYDAMKIKFNRYAGRMLDDFESLNTGQDLHDFLAVAYDVKTSFVPGSPAPDFKLPAITGQEVTLQDFRGKLVYLNFWRSACSTCQPDLPGTPESYLNDKNVVFININLDENETIWRQSVLEKKLLGIHLYAPNPNELRQQYKLTMAPAYYLIDTDGTFISIKAKSPEPADINNKMVQALVK